MQHDRAVVHEYFQLLWSPSNCPLLSCSQVGGLSSSSDERQSVGSSDSDTGGGVAALYRDSLSSVRVEAAPMKQSSEELSSLSSFDLPTEALNDKVSGDARQHGGTGTSYSRGFELSLITFC